ncbi:MAG: O-antigen ligase family protein, partial [Litorilinea sp.]
LLPFWWIFGLEQFIWPVVLTWSLFKLLKFSNFRVRIFPSTRLLFLFLIAYFTSGFFIVESYRLMTFLRSFSYNYAAICILLIVTNTCNNDDDVISVLKSVLFAYGLSVILGMLAILDIFRPSFQSPIGYILPGSIKDMQLVRQIVNQSFGNMGWFTWFGGRYFRLTSFGLYHTHYGAAMAVVIPLYLSIFYWSRSNLLKVVGGVLIVFALVNLAHTTARVAILGFALGGVYFAVIYLFRGNLRRLLHVALFTVITAAVLLVVGGIVPQIWDALTDMGQDFVFARGAGSFNSRFAVYIVTLQGWLDSPWFGWGTERHVEGMTFPAGSHSYYLGILYKHGLFGLVTFAILAFSLWRYTSPLRVVSTSMVQYSILRFGRWILIALAMYGFTDAIDLDAILMANVWTVLAILLVLGHPEYGKEGRRAAKQVANSSSNSA